MLSLDNVDSPLASQLVCVCVCVCVCQAFISLNGRRDEQKTVTGLQQVRRVIIGVCVNANPPLEYMMMGLAVRQ